MIKNPNTKKWWDGKFENGKWTDLRYIRLRLEEYMFLMDILPRHEEFSLLDIGCASGYGLNFIKEHFPLANLCGLDFSEVAIGRAKESYPEIEFECADIQTYEFSKNYTYIIIVKALEHLTEPFSILDRCLEYAIESVIISTPPSDECVEHVNYFCLRDFSNYIVNNLSSRNGLKLDIQKVTK